MSDYLTNAPEKRNQILNMTRLDVPESVEVIKSREYRWVKKMLFLAMYDELPIVKKRK